MTARRRQCKKESGRIEKAEEGGGNYHTRYSDWETWRGQEGDACGVGQMRTAVMHPPFSFTKGCPVMRIDTNPDSSWVNSHGFGALLFDIEKDPRQEHPLQDPATEQRMIQHLLRLMKESDSPVEQYERLGLPAPPA